MRRSVSIAVAALLLIAAATAPVTADRDGFVTDVFDDEDDDFIATYTGVAAGFYDRAKAAFRESSETAAEAANQTQTVFNGNATAIQSYVNNRTTAKTSRDVFAFTFEIDGESSTVYLTGDVVDGAYQNASIVDSTSRTVDESCTLEGYAARNADEELAYFISNFVTENRSLTDSYQGRLGGRYGGSVDCTFNTSS